MIHARTWVIDLVEFYKQQYWKKYPSQKNINFLKNKVILYNQYFEIDSGIKTSSSCPNQTRLAKKQACVLYVVLTYLSAS